jgi:hypothetical protein
VRRIELGAVKYVCAHTVFSEMPSSLSNQEESNGPVRR